MSKPMKKVAVIGNFGLVKHTHGGQTVKTKVLFEELQRCYGADDVRLANTEGGFMFLLKLPALLFDLLRSTGNIVILPANKGLRAIAPMLFLMNMFFQRKLHYVVVGGWLPRFLTTHRLLAKILMRYEAVYVETHSMMDSLRSIGFDNVAVMPNCKHLPIIPKNSIPVFESEPYKLCTFSRVREDKGIVLAAQAVADANSRLGREAYCLDIYGEVDDLEWFDGFMSNQPSFVRYGGIVGYENSVNVLRDYYMLLFLSFYKGEGFAGTILDAMAAGLPAIASDWHYNAEILEDGKTGFIVPVKSVKPVSDILVRLVESPGCLHEMRINCVMTAAVYDPAAVISILTSRFI